MELQASINGGRRRAAHPRLPRSAAEVGWDARDCAEAGATSVHVHPREPRRESIVPTAVARTVNAIRAAAPGLPIGVPTSAHLADSPLARTRIIDEWDVLPDFASIDWFDPWAADIARALAGRGIGIEPRLTTVGDARVWADSGFRARRVVIDVPSTAPIEFAARVLAVIGKRDPVLLHGSGASCWPAVRFARENGLGTRVGLEDTLELPDGSPAPDNAALVRAALA